jgi:hypothetical protein
MNDLLVSILARHFGVEFEPTGRRSAHVGRSADLVLRMPEELRTKIKVAAARGRSSSRDVVVAILSTRFGTRFAPAPRSRPRRARPPAASAASSSS